MKSKLLIVPLLIFTFFGCTQYGFIESQLNLSPESRLPKWVDIPSEYTRAELTMTITYYTFGYVKMVLRGPAPDNKVIMEVVGKDRWHPLTKKQGYNVFPSYSITSVGGVEEVFEQRERGNILHISDDPKITAVLKKE